MSRIAQRRAHAKSRAIPCCICQAQHPEDQTNHRMREHEHLGRRCLGSDIPFAEHSRPAMGAKVVGRIRSHDPMPNRTRALQLADGYIDPKAIEDVLAEPWSQDFHVLWWIGRMMDFAAMRRLDAEIAPIRRRPRLVERRAT